MRESVRKTATRSGFCDYLYMWERKDLGVNDNNTVTLIHQHSYNTAALSLSLSPPRLMTQRVSASTESELKWPGQQFICLLLWLVRGQVIRMFIWRFDWCDWWLCHSRPQGIMGVVVLWVQSRLSPSDRSWISLLTLRHDWSQRESNRAQTSGQT